MIDRAMGKSLVVWLAALVLFSVNSSCLAQQIGDSSSGDSDGPYEYPDPTNCMVLRPFDCPLISALRCTDAPESSCVYNNENPPKKECQFVETRELGGLPSAIESPNPWELGFDKVRDVDTAYCYQERSCEKYCIVVWDEDEQRDRLTCVSHDSSVPWADAGDSYPVREYDPAANPCHW
ncbi:MAG: hypothetical protein KatS3mg111_0468 [Pirellulaceae bacterium]|nr:MAG: hypothetical protein KatS3mg111_0468 [Pirellulaceae bacterium]